MTVGNTHCWGVYTMAVTYVMKSLKLFSFQNVENRLFSFSLMLDNDCWAIEKIWRKEFQSDLKTLAKVRNVLQ